MAEQPRMQQEIDTSDDATPFEVALYVVGIVMIPLVPILMVTFFTPWSGVSN